MRLKILMPMAGLGSRFQYAGFKEPKPLIDVGGMPMYRKALSSLNSLHYDKDHIMVIQEQHQLDYGLGDSLLKDLPHASVVMLERVTGGAAETCLKASGLLTDVDPVLIMDCDLWFRSRAYFALIEEIINNHVPCDLETGGALLYFNAESPRYSYAEIEDGMVLRTAEKEVISSNALAGAYFFSSGKIFKAAAGELIKRGITTDVKEYYISLLYNIIIASGLSVKAAPVEEYHSFGTPEELKNFEEYLGAAR